MLKENLSKQELINYFGVSKSMIETNFPKFCSKQLAQGYLIIKRGKGEKAKYDIKKVEPELKDKSYFSSRQEKIIENLPNEIWKTTYCSEAHEVSNLGRLRRKYDKTEIVGCKNKNGYINVHLGSTNYLLHRIVLQTFEPNENFENLTVDHINGKRTDNALINLKWESNENNILAMINNRKEMHKELTRIIQKFGYEETLELLKNL